MLGETLEEVTSTQYLGIYIQNNLKWDIQTQYAAGKATRVLNFISRNFFHCTRRVKEQLYKALVKPHLQYASSAWNPGTKKNKDLLEKVHRRAARFVKGDYQRTASVTSMLAELGWETIEQSRQNTRLKTFHKKYWQINLPLTSTSTSNPNHPEQEEVIVINSCFMILQLPLL